MARVERGDTVLVHYTVTLDDGTVFIDTFSKQPRQFPLGVGRAIPGLEEAIIGMKPGESKTVRVPVDKGFGPRRKEAVTTVNRDQIPPDVKPEVGKAITLRLKDQPQNYIVMDLSESTVTLDGQHPLAGKDLNCKIQLVEIVKSMFSGFHDWRSRPNCREVEPVSKDIRPLQSAWEFEQILAIVQKLKPTRILEIGSHTGGTLYHFIRLAQPRAKILSIDPRCDQYEETWRTWLTDGKALHCFPSQSQTPDLFATVRELVGKLDFLHIDGDHQYAAARNDFCTYGPLVRSGGIIALHDILGHRSDPQFCQVGTLWRQIQEAGYVTQEIYSSPIQMDMGFGLVYI